MSGFDPELLQTLLQTLTKERFRSSEIKDIVGLLARTRCVSVHQDNIIGSGATGRVYDVTINKRVHLALKLETDTIETKQKLLNEINISQICSKFITNNICINFIYLYGVIRLTNIKLNGVSVNRKLGFNTYGLFLAKADSTLSKEITNVTESNYIDIFWQIAMAIYVMRTQLNMYHNDVHRGNILLKKATRPQTIIYRNNNLGKQKTINLKTGEYYAMLADFGVASTYPLCYTDVGQLGGYILMGKSINLSDFCYLTNNLFVEKEIKSMFPLLSNIWNQIKKVYLVKAPTAYDTSDCKDTLYNDYELRYLRLSELEYFETYAFTEKNTRDIDSLNITICNVTPPETLIVIPVISLCADIDAKNCIVDSIIDQKEGDININICKKSSMQSRVRSKVPSAVRTSASQYKPLSTQSTLSSKSRK